MPIINSRSLFDDLGNSLSQTVKDALTHPCKICDAPVGEYCAPPIADNRLIHLDRTYP